MIQNENQLTSLPFYTAEKYQDRNKWWVQDVYRLVSPNDRFLPFQIVKTITEGTGGGECPPIPSAITYIGNFGAGTDEWTLEDPMGTGATIGTYYDDLRISVPAGNFGDLVVIKRKLTTEDYSYVSSQIEATMSATAACILYSWTAISCSEFEGTAGPNIAGGYSISDTCTGDTSNDILAFAFIRQTTAAIDIFINDINVVASTAAPILTEEIYRLDDDSNLTDDWSIIASSGGNASLSNYVDGYSISWGGDTTATLERTMGLDVSGSTRLVFKLNVEYAILTSIVANFTGSGGSPFQRSASPNHDFLDGEYTWTVDIENLETFVNLQISYEKTTLEFTFHEYTIIDKQYVCTEEAANLWTEAKLIDAKTEVETDIATYMNLNTDFITYTDQDYQVAVYKGDVALTAVNLPGYYYLKLSDGVDTFYSEVFLSCADMTGYVQVEWWRDVDLVYRGGRIVYSTGYINTMYLDSDIAKPEYMYDIALTDRNGFKFKEKVVSYKRFSLDVVIPESIMDVLSRLPNHEYVFFYYNGIQYGSTNTEVNEPEWEDFGDLATVPIKFETATVISSGTQVASTVNELFANDSEAINIRGNNKRIYSLSDLSILDGLYVAADRDGLPEAVRIPVSEFITGLGTTDAITFNTNPPEITTAGTIVWNNKEYTININTGLGATIQVGLETLILYYNDTGGDIDNFTVMHLKSATTVSGFLVKTFEKADASDHLKCQGTIAVATHACASGELGFLTVFGDASDGDTSGVAAGAQLWISATTPGTITDQKPVFPNYAISIGGSYNSDAVNGKIFINITGSVNDTYHEAWTGAIRESFDFLVTSDGTTVTGTLLNADPLLNLTCLFSDSGLYTFDTTTAPITIGLIPGTDSATQTNYVYIPMSTKVLTVSLTGWPTAEHCKVAVLEVQSAATVQSEGGAERNQNVNDHLKTTGDNGHILHIAERIRRLNADHDSGTEGTLTGTPTNGYIQITGGFVWQMHKQVFQSFSMPTRNIIIRNDFTTPNRRTGNLNTITAYSTGSAWSNEWGKVVVYGIANKTGEVDFVKLNLPSDGYNSEAAAIADSSNYADYTIPVRDKGVGFLIGAFVFRVSGGSLTYNGGSAYQDLRGFVPNNIAGGGGGSGVTSLLALADVYIASYAGKAGYELRVNDAETGVDAFEKELAGFGVGNGGVSDQLQSIAGNKTFLNQAHGGFSIEAFSVSKTFNADNGNNQEMEVTADTTINITGELPGTYIFDLTINSALNPVITIGASFGTPFDNNAELINSDGDQITITLYVKPSGGKKYTINTITN